MLLHLVDNSGVVERQTRGQTHRVVRAACLRVMDGREAADTKMKLTCYVRGCVALPQGTCGHGQESNGLGEHGILVLSSTNGLLLDCGGKILPHPGSLQGLPGRSLTRLATKASRAETKVVVCTLGAVPPSSLLREPPLGTRYAYTSTT
eukprot:1973631-Amphidinium_carterae.1